MVASSSAVSSAEKSTSSLRRLDTAALAAASGVRRSWLTADSSERRSSSACAMASALPASSVSSRCLTRPAACLATAVSTRRSRAGSLRPAISIQNSSSPTSIAVSAESTSTHGSVPDARDDLPSVVAARPAARSRRAASRSRGPAPAACPGRHRAAPNRRTARAVRLPARPAVASRARLRGAVDERGDRDRDHQQHDDGDRAVGFGDGERVARLDRGSSSAAARTAPPTAPPARHRRAARRPARRRRTARSRRRLRGTGRAARRSARRWPTGPRARPARTSAWRCRGESRRPPTKPRLASSWVTMWTSILPDCCTIAAPMPSSKIRAHRDRREVPITSWVAFISRAKSSSAVGTSSPTTVCTVAPRLVASSRTLPICGADTPDRPSPRTTCTTISSALDFDAIRDARRTSVSDSGPPVTATTTRSRASQVSVILLSARYFASAASTWSASHSSASSRSAVRLPAAEVVGQRGVDPLGRVDVAVGEPAPQRFRCDVDQLDLVGGADDLVGHLLLLLDAGDLRDDVVEALQVLDVDGRDHGDAGVEQFLDVLPAFRVLAARGVGVGQLVDQHHLRAGAPARRRRRVRGSGCRGTRCSAAG